MEKIVQCELGRFRVDMQLSTLDELKECEYIWTPTYLDGVFKRPDKGWLADGFENAVKDVDEFVRLGHMYKAILLEV